MAPSLRNRPFRGSPFQNPFTMREEEAVASLQDMRELVVRAWRPSLAKQSILMALDEVLAEHRSRPPFTEAPPNQGPSAAARGSRYLVPDPESAALLRQRRELLLDEWSEGRLKTIVLAILEDMISECEAPAGPRSSAG